MVVLNEEDEDHEEEAGEELAEILVDFTDWPPVWLQDPDPLKERVKYQAQIWPEI